MKILMLVNWKMHYLAQDRPDIQPPDKLVSGEPYWFFRHWSDASVHVDVLDFSYVPGLHTLEKKVIRFYVLQALRALSRSGGYDLIISHGAQSGVVLAALRRILGRRLPPHVIIDVGCFNGGRERWLELAPIRFAARSLTGIIYHASVQQDYYCRHLPWLRARFIPFGVDDEFFQPLGLGTEDYIVAIGRYQRDYHSLIEAWRMLPETEMRLKILGVSQIQDELPPGVELVDWMPIDEFKQVVGRSRFVVLPLEYRNYAYGQMTLLQSMAMGKAVVVSCVPSTVDYVSDGTDAIFVGHGDAGDLACKINALWDDPGRAAVLGNAARKTAERFNEAAMAAAVCEFVSDLILS
ncbi:MAG: glycosyltransferase family 4 protein [Thermoleophilia bacterium]